MPGERGGTRRNGVRRACIGGTEKAPFRSYGIQDGGAFLVSAITGSWSTVVGLPLDIVLERMLKAGVLGLKSSSRKSS